MSPPVLPPKQDKVAPAPMKVKQTNLTPEPVVVNSKPEIIPSQPLPSKRLNTVITPIAERLAAKAREKHLPTAKIEELHQAFQLAEISSPGITDLLVSNLISKLKSV